MPRPRKCRRVCSEPVYNCFVPKGSFCKDKVILSVDEYEIIRLIDLNGLTHEQCAARMDVSRTTVTEMYEGARYKLADSLVNGKELNIAGGCYKLCDGSAVGFCGKCRKFSNTEENFDNCPVFRCSKSHIENKKQRGDIKVKIAVAYENGSIFQHFGHTEEFKLYEAENGSIVSQQIVSAEGFGHGALADFLNELKADVLICGGIGQGAIAALEEAGIKVCGGISGSADEAVEKYLSGSLIYSSEPNCSHHHDHDHHHHGGHCGGHNGCHGKGGSCHE